MLTHAPWQTRSGLHHGFLNRRECAGGQWAAVVQAAGAPVPIATPRQVHGTLTVTTRTPAERPEADGIATDAPGLLVGIATADCAPVLLISPALRIAAAVHAGWRGASAGALEAGVAHLAADLRVRADALEAIIGPAVGGCCYEVGDEVREAFTQRSGNVTAAAWTQSRDRWRLDLRTAVKALLVAAGVHTVTVMGPCTVCDQTYNSYRRDGGAAGRQLSFVGWT